MRDAAGRLTPSPILDAYNRLAEPRRLSRPRPRMELFTTPDDEAAADRVWQNAGLHRYREVICLNPGAAFGSAKHWPAEYFAALARDLAEQRGCGVLVLCGPAERAAGAGDRRAGATSGRARPRRSGCAGAPDGPPLSLGLTKACVRRCRSAGHHRQRAAPFAAAFDRPVVTLFGPTHIAWTETYFPRAVHLQKQVDCGPCQRRVCPLDHRCMKELPARRGVHGRGGTVAARKIRVGRERR